MLCGCVPTALVALFVGFFIWLFRAPAPKKIFDVYVQPTRNFYFKVAAVYVLLAVRKWRKGKSQASSHTPGYGLKSKARVEDMDCPQPLSSHPKAIDAVYFNGANNDGYYFVMATARRPKGVINGTFYLRIPDIGILELPKMPDTLLFGDGKTFEAEGLCITPLEPMKSWKLSYDGKMKLHHDKTKIYDVLLSLTWTSDTDYFDFDTDMHPWALSRSMARETWSRQYFKDLESSHQTHYEQMGKVEGTANVDGTEYVIRVDSLRDHSYGHKREWKLLHRYGLHMLHTEDGWSINVGVVSQPLTFSVLELGYLNTPKEGKMVVSSVYLPLWQHGEHGEPPVDYAFSFVADGKTYYVEVEVVESPVFFIGWEWEARIVERFVVCKINGRRGWGVVEWQYRHHGGRPEEYQKNDPEWTENLNKG